MIVVAAGAGSRLGAGTPKAFVEAEGAPILQHALRCVARVGAAQVIVVVPDGAEYVTLARQISDDVGLAVTVVTGGAQRQASVAAGLAAVAADADFVLVHDAARAFTPVDVFRRVLERLRGGAGAVVPALPVVNTIKRVSGDRVVEAVDRAELVAAQTPQGFRREELLGAYGSAAGEFTDDAALFAASGGEVVTVPGDPLAFKITVPADLERARALRGPVIPRVGLGTDVHAFGGPGELRLAGLSWPGEQALSGHSDGDAVAHAIVDALLAAAGLGDIGSVFGTDRPEFADASGLVFLQRTRDLLREAGWSIGNVSVQVQAERPRFASRRSEAELMLGEALGGVPVSVSATTTDGLGFTGAGEGVFAMAVATVLPAG